MLPAHRTLAVHGHAWCTALASHLSLHPDRTADEAARSVCFGLPALSWPVEPSCPVRLAGHPSSVYQVIEGCSLSQQPDTALQSDCWADYCPQLSGSALPPGLQLYHSSFPRLQLSQVCDGKTGESGRVCLCLNY